MLAWYLFRHGLDLLIGVLLVKRFENCHTALEMWHEVGKMVPFEQIGVVAAVIILLASLITALSRIGRVLSSFWRRMTSWWRTETGPEG